MHDPLDGVIALLKEMPAIRFATVFGSMAEGRAGPHSDVDVAVAADGPLSSGDKLMLMDRVAAVTGRPVDLVDLATAAGPVLQQALRGRIVKCVDRDLYARILLRALYHQADDMPYRQRILEQRRRAWMQA